MTKFVKILSVLAVAVTLAACSTTEAREDGQTVYQADTTFERAQTK